MTSCLTPICHQFRYLLVTGTVGGTPTPWIFPPENSSWADKQKNQHVAFFFAKYSWNFFAYTNCGKRQVREEKKAVTSINFSSFKQFCANPQKPLFGAAAALCLVDFNWGKLPILFVERPKQYTILVRYLCTIYSAQNATFDNWKRRISQPEQSSLFNFQGKML